MYVWFPKLSFLPPALPVNDELSKSSHSWISQYNKQFFVPSAGIESLDYIQNIRRICFSDQDLRLWHDFKYQLCYLLDLWTSLCNSLWASFSFPICEMGIDHTSQGRVINHRRYNVYVHFRCLENWKCSVVSNYHRLIHYLSLCICLYSIDDTYERCILN